MSVNIENKRKMDEWNKRYPVGTLVRYADEEIETKSKAYLTYAPYPVILLSGHVKLVNLNEVDPLCKVHI